LTRPASTEVLTDLLHDFMDGLRAHFTKVSDDGERDLLVDRIFAAIAAVAGAVLVLMPVGRRRDDLAEALLAAAVRLWVSRRRAERHLTVLTPLDEEPGN
jgi:hypothetical protein